MDTATIHQMREKTIRWFLPHRNALRQWAYDHACLLTFSAGFFFITWVIIIGTELFID